MPKFCGERLLMNVRYDYLRIVLYTYIIDIITVGLRMMVAGN